MDRRAAHLLGIRFAECELEIRNQVRTDQSYKAGAPGRNVSSAGWAGL